MGRIRTTFIKRTASKILDKYKSIFSTDFDANKKVLKKEVDIPSKKLRNKIVDMLLEKNVIQGKKLTMKESTRLRLLAVFKGDIEQLEDLLNVNLSHWKG